MVVRLRDGSAYGKRNETKPTGPNELMAKNWTLHVQLYCARANLSKKSAAELSSHFIYFPIQNHMLR